MFEQGTHFYFMATIGPGGVRNEMTGTVTPAPGSTRHSIYRELREVARDGFDCPANGIMVVAFTLEPNEIGA